MKVEDAKAAEEEVPSKDDTLIVEENNESDLDEVSEVVEESKAEVNVQEKKIDNKKPKKATSIIEPKV